MQITGCPVFWLPRACDLESKSLTTVPVDPADEAEEESEGEGPSQPQPVAHKASDTGTTAGGWGLSCLCCRKGNFSLNSWSRLNQAQVFSLKWKPSNRMQL